jgi:septal ring factor EnvC (AmiA/AmiB activator)
MKSILLVLIVFSLAGCAYTSRKFKTQIIELQGSLSRKDEEIKKLEDLLQEKERILKEKDSKIEELSKKLEGLGVFE